MTRIRSRRWPTVTDKKSDIQGVTAHLTRRVHDVFDQIARERGMSKGTLNRLLIEAVTASPDIIDELLKGKQSVSSRKRLK